MMKRITHTLLVHRPYRHDPSADLVMTTITFAILLHRPYGVKASRDDVIAVTRLAMSPCRFSGDSSEEIIIGSLASL